MLFKPRFYALLFTLPCAAAAIFTSTAATAHDGGKSAIDINFAQTYAVAPCAASAPASNMCLNVTGTSNSHEVGALRFSRVATFNPGQFDYTHPTCIVIETAGTLTLPRGTLTFHAPGNVCFTEGIAAYNLIITGGTGAYAGAIGGGQIIVPPPQTSSTGRELWHLELITTDQNDYRFK